VERPIGPPGNCRCSGRATASRARQGMRNRPASGPGGEARNLRRSARGPIGDVQHRSTTASTPRQTGQAPWLQTGPGLIPASLRPAAGRADPRPAWTRWTMRSALDRFASGDASPGAATDHLGRYNEHWRDRTKLGRFFQSTTRVYRPSSESTPPRCAEIEGKGGLRARDCRSQLRRASEPRPREEVAYAAADPESLRIGINTA